MPSSVLPPIHEHGRLRDVGQRSGVGPTGLMGVDSIPGSPCRCVTEVCVCGGTKVETEKVSCTWVGRGEALVRSYAVAK